MLDFLTLQTTSNHSSLISILYTVLLSFLLSSLIAITYQKTFRGISYSRSFLQSLILSSIVAGTLMQAIGENPMRGLGVLGALAIIRFRTVFKDPRDIIFMFASVGAGISCGVFGYAIAIIGTLGFCGIAFILYFSPFGSASFFDGLLKFSVDISNPDKMKLETIMHQYCKNFALITLAEMTQGLRVEYAYHVNFKTTSSKEDFINEISSVKTIKNIQLLLQETTVEL